jgi:hypothetical protein
MAAILPSCGRRLAGITSKAADVLIKFMHCYRAMDGDVRTVCEFIQKRAFSIHRAESLKLGSAQQMA